MYFSAFLEEQIPNDNTQISKQEAAFGNSNLGIVICLEFGVWKL
jgi:hypothetical protein